MGKRVSSRNRDDRTAALPVTGGLSGVSDGAPANLPENTFGDHGRDPSDFRLSRRRQEYEAGLPAFLAAIKEADRRRRADARAVRAGTMVDRSRLARLVSDVEAGRIDMVIIESVDRLSRPELGPTEFIRLLSPARRSNRK
ncbi:MAG: recombinase family protein [Xanthobacteraceae bacterium]|nr:recombinase family protein [Xanthobacteraceae bacterium]